MDYWQALILGVIQGMTEFLPVSSSGHLVIVQTWLHIPASAQITFAIVVHLGTLMALLTYFYRDLKEMAMGLLALDSAVIRLTGCLIAGILPIIAIYWILRPYIERLFENPLLTSFCLIVTGCILMVSDRRPGYRQLKELRLSDALWIGVGQALAILPGISRSGSTMAAGLWRNLSRADAARFSFLLAVPVILGAGILDLKDLSGAELREIGVFNLGLGFSSAGIIGYLVIKYFMNHLQKGSLRGFAYYCIGIGILSGVFFGCQ